MYNVSPADRVPVALKLPVAKTPVFPTSSLVLLFTFNLIGLTVFVLLMVRTASEADSFPIKAV